MAAGMRSASWCTGHILSFVRFTVAATFSLSLPGLSPYFQDQEHQMVLNSLPFGSFFELSYRAALLQDALFASMWPGQWAMYKAIEIFKFDVSEDYFYMTIVLFTDLLGALISTLNHWMPVHQVQCLIIGSAITVLLGQQLAAETLTPLGFEKTEPGVFRLWLNNPSASVDMQQLSTDTQNAIAELSAMYPSAGNSGSPDSAMS